MNVLNSLIVGPGAIGALTCAELTSYGPVWVHSHRKNLQLAKSLKVKSQSVTLNWQLLDKNKRPSPTPIDLIWVCCKAPQVMPTLLPLLKQHPNALAVLLHNGMGPQEALSQQFDGRVIWGSTTCGALATGPSEFSQTSFGTTELGLNKNDRAQQKLHSLISKTGNKLRPLNLQISDNIEAILWRKLLINACINPLTAALNIRNGQLRGEKYHADIHAIITEVNAIMQAHGIAPVEDAFTTVMHVCEFSADNYSSMAVDVQQKRVTEIDYINGYLINQAELYQQPAIALKKWHKRIASLSES